MKSYMNKTQQERQPSNILYSANQTQCQWDIVCYLLPPSKQHSGHSHSLHIVPPHQSRSHFSPERYKAQ